MDTDLKKLRDVLIALGPLTDAEGYTFTCTPPAAQKQQYMCGWLGEPFSRLCDEKTYESAVAALGAKPEGHPGCVVVSGAGVLYPPKPTVTWRAAPASTSVKLHRAATCEEVIRETVRQGREKYPYWNWGRNDTFPIVPSDESLSVIHVSREDFAHAVASL